MWKELLKHLYILITYNSTLLIIYNVHFMMAFGKTKGIMLTDMKNVIK